MPYVTSVERIGVKKGNRAGNTTGNTTGQAGRTVRGHRDGTFPEVWGKGAEVVADDSFA